jgi:hypothetical protein
MAEEEKVEEKTEATPKEEVVPEIKKEPEAEPIPPTAETPQVDPDVAAIREELNQVKQKQELSEEKARKFDEVSQAITGKEPGFDKDKFFQDLADDPEKTLDKFVSSKTESLENEIKEQKLKDADTQAFNDLRSKYSDFNDVIKDASKYITKEDVEVTENLPNRTEIRFSLAKSRRDADMATRKSEETNAMNEAKKISNQTSVTETPSTGASIPSAESEVLERLAKAKENRDTEEVSKILANDLWFLSGQGRP